MKGTSPLDIAKQSAGKGGRPGRIERPFPGVLKILGCYRLTITPVHIVPQVKDVLSPLICYLPALGDIWHHIQLRAESNQSAKQLMGQADRPDASGPGWVECA